MATPPKTQWKPARAKRRGPLTAAEKDLVAAVVRDAPGTVTPGQVHGLAVALRRSKMVMQGFVQQARDNFAASADRYVSIHKEAAEKALADGSVAGLEVAAKSAQWALTNLSAEGVRVIDRPDAGATGSRIIVGIQVGGHPQATTTLAVPPTATETAGEER